MAVVGGRVGRTKAIFEAMFRVMMMDDVDDSELLMLGPQQNYAASPRRGMTHVQ